MSKSIDKNARKKRQIKILIVLVIVIIIGPLLYTNLAYKSMLDDANKYQLNQYYDHNLIVKFSTIKKMRSDIDQRYLIEQKLKENGITSIQDLQA